MPLRCRHKAPRQTVKQVRPKMDQALAGSPLHVPATAWPPLTADGTSRSNVEPSSAWPRRINALPALRSPEPTCPEHSRMGRRELSRSPCLPRRKVSPRECCQLLTKLLTSRLKPPNLNLTDAAPISRSPEHGRRIRIKTNGCTRKSENEIPTNERVCLDKGKTR